MAWFGFFGAISVEFFSFALAKNAVAVPCLERDLRNGWPSPPKFRTEWVFCGGRQQKDGSIRQTSRYASALSPKTGEKAVADQDDVGWPFGMLREYSLLGVDAVHQRRPTD
jgi:hypothetical protein